jgi:glycosyltransferase involved in cell wall biosynthesis
MLCVGPHLEEGVRGRGAPAEKVEYFPNGVDTRRFPGLARPAERAAARAALGLEPSATVLLHVGRAWRLKGGDLFLDAFERLDGERLHALMLRGGDVARSEVERRRLGDRVTVLEGMSDVRRVHAASDIMLATSRGEGMPFAVLEALSSGLGVVATDIPGHAFAGGTPAGLRIAKLTPQAIAEEAGELLARELDTARGDSAATHDWVRETFGLEAWTSRLLAVYDSIVGPWADERERS